MKLFWMFMTVFQLPGFIGELIRADMAGGFDDFAIGYFPVSQKAHWDFFCWIRTHEGFDYYAVQVGPWIFVWALLIW